MIVGETQRGGAGTAVTLMLAEAVPPEPASTEVTGLVVLFLVLAVVPVTFTLKAHELDGAIVAPLRLTTPDPGDATMVPPPQLPAKPLGLDTTRPSGSASVKPTPVNVVDLLGLSSVKPSEVDSPTVIVTAPKDLAIVGGNGSASTTSVKAFDILVGCPSSSISVAEIWQLYTALTVGVPTNWFPCNAKPESAGRHPSGLIPQNRLPRTPTATNVKL